MKLRHKLSVAAALLCVCAVSSCKSGEGDEPSQNLKAARMDISGATALTVIGPGGSRASSDVDPDLEFQQPGLFKVDAQGNVSAVPVFLVTDGDGNSSSREISTNVQPDRIVDINEAYFGLTWCVYRSSEDGTTVPMPELYRDLVVRKADGRIFAVGGNQLMSRFLSTTPTSVTVGADEYILYVWNLFNDGNGESFGEYMARLKFADGELTLQQMSTNGMQSEPKLYLNGNIYTLSSVADVMSTHNAAGICFATGGYDIFEPESFGAPKVSCYVLLDDGFGAIRRAEVNSVQYDLSFNIVDAEAPGAASLRPVAAMNAAPFEYSIARGYCQSGTKVLLQHYVFDDYSYAYSVVDLAAGTWEPYQAEFGNVTGLELLPENLYKGRVWGVLERNGRLQPTAIWINPATLESGTVNLDFDANGIDIRSTEKDFGNGRLVVYATRRSDNANLVIEADITTGRCTTVATSESYKIETLVPLN